MPELPEVETIVRCIASMVTGETIQGVTIRTPKLRVPIPALDTLIRGGVVRSVGRRAKYLLFRFDTGTLIVHFGMTGKFYLATVNDQPSRHDHVDLLLPHQRVLRFRDPRRFGAFYWQAGDALSHPSLAKLGPEPLTSAFDAHYLYAHIHLKRSAVKACLLDQYFIAGVGNIYANEVLFHAGIHPTTGFNQLTYLQCERLVKAIQAVLTNAIKIGTTYWSNLYAIDKTLGYFSTQYHVYARVGQPCRVCQSTIQKIRQQQRASFYCPYCQKH